MVDNTHGEQENAQDTAAPQHEAFKADADVGGEIPPVGDSACMDKASPGEVEESGIQQPDSDAENDESDDDQTFGMGDAKLINSPMGAKNVYYYQDGARSGLTEDPTIDVNISAWSTYTPFAKITEIHAAQQHLCDKHLIYIRPNDHRGPTAVSALYSLLDTMHEKGFRLRTASDDFQLAWYRFNLAIFNYSSPTVTYLRLSSDGANADYFAYPEYIDHLRRSLEKTKNHLIVIAPKDIDTSDQNSGSNASNSVYTWTPDPCSKTRTFYSSKNTSFTNSPTVTGDGNVINYNLQQPDVDFDTRDSVHAYVKFIAAFFRNIPIDEFSVLITLFLGQHTGPTNKSSTSDDDSADAPKTPLEHWHEAPDQIIADCALKVLPDETQRVAYRFSVPDRAEALTDHLLSTSPHWLTMRLDQLLDYFFRTEKTSNNFRYALFDYIVRLHRVGTLSIGPDWLDKLFSQYVLTSLINQKIAYSRYEALLHHLLESSISKSSATAFLEGLPAQTETIVSEWHDVLKQADFITRYLSDPGVDIADKERFEAHLQLALDALNEDQLSTLNRLGMLQNLVVSSQSKVPAEHAISLIGKLMSETQAQHNFSKYFDAFSKFKPVFRPARWGTLFILHDYFLLNPDYLPEFGKELLRYFHSIEKSDKKRISDALISLDVFHLTIRQIMNDYLFKNEETAELFIHTYFEESDVRKIADILSESVCLHSPFNPKELYERELTAPSQDLIETGRFFEMIARALLKKEGKRTLLLRDRIRALAQPLRSRLSDGSRRELRNILRDFENRYRRRERYFREHRKHEQRKNELMRIDALNLLKTGLS